jgi:hypothetical protein
MSVPPTTAATAIATQVENASIWAISSKWYAAGAKLHGNFKHQAPN